MTLLSAVRETADTVRAYYAQFRAALALIVERTSKTPKTHRGVTRLFHQIAKTEAGIDQAPAGDQTIAYRFKELAGYETTMVRLVTRQNASDAIAGAEHFATEVRRVLLPPPPGSPAP